MFPCKFVIHLVATNMNYRNSVYYYVERSTKNVFGIKLSAVCVQDWHGPTLINHAIAYIDPFDQVGYQEKWK